MTELLTILTPELILTGTACILFLLGCSGRPGARRLAPILALCALVLVIVLQVAGVGPQGPQGAEASLRLDPVAAYLRILAPSIGIILLLLAWPSNADATGNTALDFGADGGEFFGLFLLSITGLLLVTLANDLIILFLALELVSIPTYIMVSISRSRAVAQEAGVKYFFLGALALALMLFGFSYLYGATGQINLTAIGQNLQKLIASNGTLPPWHKLGVLLIILGFAFKMAAFPLHFYAGDVYEGAATPVTAFLAFVPKTAGFAALIKILLAVGGPEFHISPQIASLLWVLAALTMTIGNVLGLLQTNVKRVLAYSSVAHSGYMLVGIAALPSAGDKALSGVLFYLAAYGMMNATAFGILMLLPSRDGQMAAETFEDLAGQGRRHIGLGLAMTVACFSLIGIPLTVGFFGKLLLIYPALYGGLYWLVIILVVNAAISAAYYLRIVATMFLRPEPTAGPLLAPPPGAQRLQFAVLTAVLISVAATLTFGTIPGAADRLASRSYPQPTSAPGDLGHAAPVASQAP